MSDHETIELSGTTYPLGLLAHPCGRQTLCAVFEDHVQPWTEAKLIEWAKAQGGKRAKFFDSSWVENQGSHGCHDEKTEVLTDSGWTKWTDYDWKSSLGTMNPISGLLEYQQPTEKHVYEYHGPMLQVDHRSLDFSVTPNHRMLVNKWSEPLRRLSPRPEFVLAEKLGWYFGLPHATRGHQGVELKRVAIPGGREYSGDDFVALLGVIVSDGYVANTDTQGPRIGFCCFKAERQEAVRSLAARCGFTEQKSRPGVWTVRDPALMAYLKSEIYNHAPYRSLTKRIPKIIRGICERQVNHFLWFFGDKSTNQENGVRTFVSCSKSLIDGLQELLLMIGKRGTITQREARGSVMKDGREIKAESGHTEYSLYERKTELLSVERKKQMQSESYNGLVFCATVPNGTLVTRRNGQTLISGNSCAGYSAASCLSKARVLRGLPRVDLSGAYLYSRCKPDGQDSGSMLQDHMEAVAKFGSCKETTVTVNQINRRDYNTAKADAEAANFKAWEPYAVGSRLGLFTAIAMGFPVEIAVHVGGGFDQLDGNGYPGGSSGGGNHAVHADDLVLIGGKLALCGQNSWGRSFGRNGRMMLDWDRHLSRPWENHVAFAIRSTLDGVA